MLALLALPALSALLAPFDDGWMPFQGSAFSMGGKHPSVRMVSEVVRATVHKTYSTVQCDFVFRNEGEACKVKMGFPAAGEKDWEDLKEKADRRILTNFKSYIDGKSVKTQHVVLEETADPQAFHEIRQWEVKEVSFAKGATVRVRDTYRTPHGNSNVSENQIVQHFFYILSTGGTWKGNIDRADVIVTFASDVIPGKVKFVKDDGLADPDDPSSPKYAQFFTKNRSSVSYSGPCTPTFKGRTITFTKKDWSPDDTSNVILTFGIKRDRG